MFRVSVLVIACLTMSGCALTRVSDASHAKEISQLNAVGLDLDTARAMATQKGFDCSESVTRNVSVQSRDGIVRKTDVLTCNKASMELFCPQRRYVVFNAYPDTGKVYSVGQRINQTSCF